jgi:hypothetical protein
VFAFEVLDAPHPTAKETTAALVSAINTLRVITMTRPFSGYGSTVRGRDGVRLEAAGGGRVGVGHCHVDGGLAVADSEVLVGVELDLELIGDWVLFLEALS